MHFCQRGVRDASPRCIKVTGEPIGSHASVITTVHQHSAQDCVAGGEKYG